MLNICKAVSFDGPLSCNLVSIWRVIMGLAKIFSLNYSRQIRQEVVLTNQIATVNSKLLVPVFYRLYLVSVSRLAQISFSELGCLFARLRKSRKAKSPSPKACFFYSLQFYSPLLPSSPLPRPPPPLGHFPLSLWLLRESWHIPQRHQHSSITLASVFPHSRSPAAGRPTARLGFERKAMPAPSPDGIRAAWSGSGGRAGRRVAMASSPVKFFSVFLAVSVVGWVVFT
jgi:hypothetical protein